jgi:UTP--glucose-1-phosphate uridylyltransferase
MASPPKIKLDPKFFGQIEDFERRFQHGVPSLADCDSLTVEGDVFFETDVTLRGHVNIKNESGTPYTIEAGSVIDQSFEV